VSLALDQLPGLMEPIARELLGEPNRSLSKPDELRFGKHGSLSVDLTKGTYYDHEAGKGGGVLDLIERELHLRGLEREHWIGERYPHAIEDRPKSNGRRHSRKEQLGKEVAQYDYTDEAGDLLFQQVRFEPKNFRQRRRARDDDPHWLVRDGWVYSSKGVRQVPYRLPELVEAVAEERIVFVVEGEKDVDRLMAAGAPATCNAGGAGKWPESLNAYFRDADVVVIADNDPQARNQKTGELRFHEDGRPVYPGQDHALAVCANLSEVARRVRYLDLKSVWPACPLKGDISDWLDAGRTVEQLYDVIERAPDWSPELQGPEAERPELPKFDYISLPSLVGKPVPQRDWVVLNRIPNRNVTLLSGDGGVGKTLLAQQLAVATVLGRDWIGALPKPGPVLFYSAEDDSDEIHFRLAQIVAQYGVDFDALADLHTVSLVGKDTVMAAAGQHGLVKPTTLFEAVIRDAKDIRPAWIGFDTAADVFLVEERDRAQARQCINLLRGLAHSCNCGVLLLSHPSLAGMASGTGLSGSTAWNNSVRSRLYLRSAKSDDADDETDLRILEVMKANYTAKGEQISLRWRDGLLVMEGTALAPAASPMERASVEARARNLLRALVSRFNGENRTVSPKPTSNNGIGMLAKLPEARSLHPNERMRKQLLTAAMNELFADRTFVVGWGPHGASRSKQNECILINPDGRQGVLL
jgi:hypothetical protein